MYIMTNYYHNTHYHLMVLEPNESIDREPYTLKNIIDFFYSKPDFYINRCITPGFIKSTEMVLSNNFTPVEISKYEKYYEKYYILPKPTEAEMKAEWSLKNFMIKCYEMDLEYHDEPLSAKTLITVTKDAIRIDGMKSAGVVGQHALSRDEFIDAFLLMKKGEVTDLNVSVGIFTNNDECMCNKIKPIDIRLRYKIRRSGFELKDDPSTWDKLFSVTEMTYVSDADKDEDIRLIKLKTLQDHYFKKGDFMKISGLIYEPEPFEVLSNLTHWSYDVKIAAVNYNDKIKVGMIVKHEYLKVNTVVKSIDKTGDPYIVKISKPAFISVNNPDGYKLTFCQEKNPFYLTDLAIKDTAIIDEVGEKFVVVKSLYKIPEQEDEDNDEDNDNDNDNDDVDDNCEGVKDSEDINQIDEGVEEIPESSITIRKLFKKGEKCKLEYLGTK